MSKPPRNQSWIPVHKTNQAYKFTPVEHIWEGDYVITQAVEGLQFRGHEIFRVTKRTSYKNDDILLEWECVNHPVGNVSGAHGDNNQFYSQGYYPRGKKLLVLHPNEVNMLLLRE